nr:rhodanese-like domain-containing protein [Actinomycetales bacterium]
MARELPPEQIHVSELASDTPVPPGTHLLDVREPDEWNAGHAPGAIHIPLGDLSARVAEIPDGPLYVVCRGGGRSSRAAAWLREFGYEATNLDGGMSAWSGRSLPMTRDDGGAPSVI